ncbi:hypothetical protein D5086_010188 [Populus alba]|uniref:Uncharacterized protein n=1 Tax=Populus alba TaxID=43335 RepID=A0ACC4C8N5_POPAL
MREPVDLWKPYERYPDIVYTTADHKSWHLPLIRLYPLMPRHACWISDVRTSQSFKSRATPLTGMKTDLSPVVARRAVEITDKPLISSAVNLLVFLESHMEVVINYGSQSTKRYSQAVLARIKSINCRTDKLEPSATMYVYCLETI